MSDLVKRLRSADWLEYSDARLCEEAADRIAELEAALEQKEMALRDLACAVDAVMRRLTDVRDHVQHARQATS